MNSALKPEALERHKKPPGLEDIARFVGAIIELTCPFCWWLKWSFTMSATAKREEI